MRYVGLQTCGTIVVVGAFAAAEMSAWLLDAHPGWPLAWYLNLHVFRLFELARADASPLRFAFAPTSLGVALATIALALWFERLRFRFGIALLANLSFLAALALARCAWQDGAIRSADAFGAVSVRGGLEGPVVATLLAASFVAVLTCHLRFCKAAFAVGVRGGTPPDSPDSGLACAPTRDTGAGCQ